MFQKSAAVLYKKIFVQQYMYNNLFKVSMVRNLQFEEFYWKKIKFSFFNRF